MAGYVSDPDKPLTPKQEAFCQEYLIDRCAAKAAARAGYTAKAIAAIGHRLIHLDQVKKRIDELLDEQAKRTAMSADNALSLLWSLATADSSEICEVQKSACRHCYGVGFKYQRTQFEVDDHAATEEAKRERAATDEKYKPKYTTLDVSGGVGFDPTLRPHPHCPKCFGEGIARVVIRDLRDVSPAARKLFAGVKQTKDGIEIKFREQDGALLNVLRYFGLLNDKMDVTSKGESINLSDEQRADRILALIESARARRASEPS